jgi:hypothetical protein
MKMDNLFLMLMDMKLIMNKNNIFIAFGILIISYILYIRVILVRLPKELPTQPDLFESISYSLIASIFFSLFLYATYRLYRRYNTVITSENFVIVWLKYQIFKPILDWYYKSLKALDYYLKDVLLVNHLGTALNAFGTIFNSIFSRVVSKKYFFTYLCFDLLSKFFILLIFSYDVYHHNFHYIYKASLLLLIPILYKYIVFTLREFAEFNIRDIYGDILIYYFHSGIIMTADDIINNCKGTISLEDNYHNLDPKFSMHVIALTEPYKQECYANGRNLIDDIMFYEKQLNFYIRIRSSIAKLDNQTKYNIYFDCIRYGVYSMLWIYILVYIGMGLPDDTLLEIFNDEEPFSVTSIQHEKTHH